MDHLGIDKFMVMGFCIGGPFIWNLLKRAPDRVVAAVLAQPVGSVRRCATVYLRQHYGRAGARTWSSARPEITMETVEKFLTKMFRNQPRLRLHRDARFRAQLPDAGADPAGRYPGASVRRRHGVPRCSRRKPK